MIVSARRRSAARRPGFTLLEVLVVVAILVILAGVAGVYVFGFLDGAKVDSARTQCEFFEKNCKAFYAKHNRSPNGLIELVAPDPTFGKPLVEGGEAALADPWGKGQYMLDNTQTDMYGAPEFIVSCYEDGNQGKQVFSARRVKKQ